MAAGKILIVATSHRLLGNSGEPTGCWYEEVASPYYLWKEKGYDVEIASIQGGEVPFDPVSKEGDFATPETLSFLADTKAQEAVTNTRSVEQVLASDELGQYDAVFLPGGHGIVWDGGEQHLKALLDKMWAAGKVVSAVCHGPGGLLRAVDERGEPIVKGRNVTGFSNAEERAVKKADLVPYLLEDKLKELGGNYTAGPDFHPHALSDGRLVTGQNPSSSKRMAELVLEILLPTLRPTHEGKGPGEGFKHRGHDVTHPHHDHQAER